MQEEVIMIDLDICKERMELGKRMDVALHYVAKNLSKTGHNSKPVLSHSFRVANKLYQEGYEEEIVLSAVLHDLIEDTAVTRDDIANEFGDNIANIVEAVSFDPKIEDKLEQARLMFQNCLDYGLPAVLVKCSDLLDNIDYVIFVEDEKKRKVLLSKYELFLKMSEDEIGEIKIYKELAKKLRKLLSINSKIYLK